MAWWHNFSAVNGLVKIDRRRAFANGHRPHPVYERCKNCMMKWNISDLLQCVTPLKFNYWIGVDLDGTLAEDIVGGKYDPARIGRPIPRMVAIIREHIAKGEEVRIFTARAATVDHHTVFNGTPEEYRQHVVAAIKAWCVEHIGIELEVTAVKDYRMKLFYDDRAKSVVRNQGVVIAGCDVCIGASA